METKEFFTSRINDNGQTQFAFGLEWMANPEGMQTEKMPLDKQGNAPQDPQRFARQKNLYSAQIDKQAKLALEDQAARQLASQINKRQICENGHKVEQVIWEMRRIRLMGHCL